MSPNPEAGQEISTTLHKYCDYFDSADFDAFADLFSHGRWFMVDGAGSQPVREWINQHIVLYNGRPLTRHEVSNIITEGGADADEAAFRCYVSIWQHLPENGPRLLAHARFTGTFRRGADGWQWREHVMDLDYAGDLSTHIIGIVTPVRTP